MIVEPASEPLTLTEAKLHVNMPLDETSRDQDFIRFISTSRQQFEADVNIALIVRTVEVKLSDFCTFAIPRPPLVSVESVTYYDRSNVLQTLPSNKYSLDTASGLIRFESNTYPGVADRWDAVKIVYKIGKHADSTTVDAWSKSAMLLLVGHYDANREMLVPDNMASMVAYERICKLRHRGTYP